MAREAIARGDIMNQAAGPAEAFSGPSPAGSPSRVRSPFSVMTKVTEAKFRRQVIQAAAWLGWKVAGFRAGMNRRGKWSTPMDGEPGWPDLFLVHKHEKRAPLALELKVGRNVATVEQCRWVEAMRLAGIEAEVVYPEDWDWIEAKLRGE